ncbi:MAG: hypothetical protein PF482_00940 [Desulfobacteraceae bacterium]|jgi:hypothetical protein|nr:hypothetical protein [Desulfobacteraceae bacterium]
MKKILMIAVMIVAMTGTAWSFSADYVVNDGTLVPDWVTEAPGMVGDALIFPVYLADGTGWEAKINVINTSRDYSTVAKVVINGGKNSQELLDFFIYLSPNDEWTAKIYNDNGVVRIYSDDDSVRSSVATWGDEVPLNQTLVDNPCDEEVYGYVTVFDSWIVTRSQLNYLAPAGTDFDRGPIPKSAILEAYGAQGNLNPGIFNSANILTGSYEIMLPTLGLSATENAVVLQDYDVTSELELGRYTFFGQDCRNSAAEIEAAIAKDNVFMPYYNNGQNITAFIFTFPTKQSQVNTDCDVSIDSLGSEYFRDNLSPDFCVPYGIYPFDLEENTPQSSSPIFSPVPRSQTREFCDEVNISVVGLDSSISFYDEGWALFEFGDVADSPYTVGLAQDNVSEVEFKGVPVIPMSANLGADGLSLKYGAYDPADVYRYGTIVE